MSYFMLNMNLTDEQCERLLKAEKEHRRWVHKVNMEILKAQMQLEKDLLSMQQEPSRLLSLRLSG